MATISSSPNANKKIAMHWFRKGLRLTDNPGLVASCWDAREFYPCYICDGDSYQLLHSTALRANFLVECLQDLDQQLQLVNSRLYVESGDPVILLPKLWKEFHITHLTFEHDETGEPYAKARDEAILQLAKQRGIQVETFCSETLFPLHDYVQQAGSKVPNTMGSFKSLMTRMGPVVKPLDAPKSALPAGKPCPGLYLPPTKATDLPWPRNIPKDQVEPIWGPDDLVNLTPIVRGGESKALRQLQNTVTARPTYVATFEKPKTSCTSLSPSTTAISPYMSLGCLSPRTVWYAIEESLNRSNCSRSQPPVSLHGQLMWRDFNNLMAHTANLHQPGSWGCMDGNMHSRIIPWDRDETLLRAWKTGQTGYPWIDACMRQLEREGWIHHLGRHAVACFLTRGDLWQSWEVGAEHFESHLLDADYALNGFNWLWLSCSGFFYQYFRCYSPVAFQKKNDPRGEYIRKHLPVLAKLPDKYIYEPWKAPAAVQQIAGIKIGVDYPKPIVDHGPVSKENMSKMAAAYEAHKATQSAGAGGEGKAKGSKSAKTTARKGGSKRRTASTESSRSSQGESKAKKTRQSKITF